MAAHLYFGIVDNSGEIGRVQIPIEDPTLISGVGSVQDHLTEFAASIGGVTLGNIRTQYAVVEQTDTTGLPASQWAQRELGMRIIMQGNTTANVYTLTIPAIDLDAITLQPSSDDVVLADAGVMAALVLDLEERFEPAPGGVVENVTVVRAYVVGRNS